MNIRVLVCLFETSVVVSKNLLSSAVIPCYIIEFVSFVFIHPSQRNVRRRVRHVMTSIFLHKNNNNNQQSGCIFNDLFAFHFLFFSS